MLDKHSTSEFIPNSNWVIISRVTASLPTCQTVWQRRIFVSILSFGSCYKRLPDSEPSPVPEEEVMAASSEVRTQDLRIVRLTGTLATALRRWAPGFDCHL